MKRLTTYLIVVTFILAFGIFAWGANHINLPSSIESPCGENSFTVESQAEAPAQLTIVEAICNGSTWEARLKLENSAGKVICAYEVEYIESYEYKKDVWSAQGESGFKLEPGEAKVLNFNGGFPTGLSYEKPTGQIETNVFSIKRIEFSDGDKWESNKRSE